MVMKNKNGDDGVEFHTCRGNYNNSWSTKVLHFVIVSFSCYLFYRVTVLETRLRDLETEVSFIRDVEKITGYKESEDVLSKRIKRNTQECVCPPGNRN